jgi:hypothetical protein
VTMELLHKEKLAVLLLLPPPSLELLWRMYLVITLNV